MCHNNGLELIGQIVNGKNKKPTNIYCCPKCKATYIKDTFSTYRRLTPYYFVSDL